MMVLKTYFQILQAGQTAGYMVCEDNQKGRALVYFFDASGKRVDKEPVGYASQDDFRKAISLDADIIQISQAEFPIPVPGNTARQTSFFVSKSRGVASPPLSQQAWARKQTILDLAGGAFPLAMSVRYADGVSYSLLVATRSEFDAFPDVGQLDTRLSANVVGFKFICN